jgi:hypothetical protein
MPSKHVEALKLPSAGQMRKELRAEGWRIKKGYWVHPKTGQPVIALNNYMAWFLMNREKAQKLACHAVEAKR